MIFPGQDVIDHHPSVKGVAMLDNWRGPPANEECPDAGRSKIRGIVAEDAQFGSVNAFQRHWSYKKCSDTDRGRNDERYM